MAYFAQLDENNIVINVIKIDNDVCLENGIESEATGIAFCNSLIEGRWVQTSYNARIRKNYAGISFFYDSEKDAFIPPQPFASWVLDENTCQWRPPSVRPDDGYWVWDEALLSWARPQTS